MFPSPFHRLTLCSRRIKTAKIRRPAGGAAVSSIPVNFAHASVCAATADAMPSHTFDTPASRRAIRRAQETRMANAQIQTPSQSANFGSAPSSSFNFGASAPAVGGTTNGMFGAGNNAFGGGATNSFPPAQSAAPSSTFSNSSFPAFGASSQSTGFNPQPPAANDFNFTAGNSNPFGASNTPAMNGNGSSSMAFGGGGGSVFNSQTPSNPFAGLGSNINTSSSASTGGMFGTASAAPSSSMFGTSSAPPSNMFGTTSSAANVASTPAPASTPFTFGGATSSAQPASTPAPAASPFQFGAATSSAQPASTPAPASTPFMFGAAASSSAQPASTPAPSNPFGGLAKPAAPAQNSLFTGFGAGASAQNGSAAQQETPQKSLFSTSTTTENATATAPSTNLFNFGGAQSSTPGANNFLSQPPASAAPSAPSFSFGQQTSQAQESAPTQASNLFGAIKLPEEPASTPKPALFGSVTASQQTAAAPAETPKANPFASLAKPSTVGAPKLNLFGATQSKDKEATPKPAGTATSEAPAASKPSLFTGGFSTPQPAKTADAEKPQAGLFTAQPKSTSNGIFAQTFQPEKLADNAFKNPPSFPLFKSQTTAAAEPPKPSQAKDASNPFATLPKASSSERPNLFAPQKQQPPTPAPSSMPTLTGAAPPSLDTSSAPELPKIPKAHVPKEWNTSNINGAGNTNGSYKLITNLTIQLQQLNERYRTKLNSLAPTADWSALSLWHHQQSSAIKKQIDTAKKERAASKGVTGHETALSTKRKVNDDSPEDRHTSPTKRARPAEVPATPTPQPSAAAPKFNPPASATSNIFAKAINNKPAAASEQTNLFAPKPAQAEEPSKPSGFQFKSASTASPAPPTFKPVTAGSSGGFASQFAASAKTYEQLAAERKKKAMDEDYDSDDETKAEWSARYDKEEAERIAKEKATVAQAPGFSLGASSKSTGTSSSTSAFAPSTKPASGTTTPGLFGSRPASPALSATGSVFDAPSTAQTPSSNIFGHLSSGASSNHQDESEEEGENVTKSTEPTTPPKRKFGDSEANTTESLDEAAKQQKQTTTSKGSLFSRITRDDDGSESEKENNGTTNGTFTPTNKPFAFFDFNAAGAKTAPPKSDTFAGDQTFKPGTPIKFGEAATEKKAAPLFNFQAPSNSSTPSKPPPTNLFNFGSTGGSSLLTPNSALSGLGSMPSSTFTSRAATPLSEADNSAAEDDEEGGNHEQVDLSQLTPEEISANDVVFETDLALAKHQVDDGEGKKRWENFARGPLYILKDKVTGKCFVRIRLPSGQTPLNYSILPSLKAQLAGASRKMVQCAMPKKEGGISNFFISFKTSDVAEDFSTNYNASLPS